jgi:hypothetical protein
MSKLLSIIDSLLLSGKVKAEDRKLFDSTVYLITTQRQSYCGHIIFQDNTVIKFRTDDLKPVKILKENIKSLSILKQAYLTVA